MTRYKLEKLVRDKIVASILISGGKVKYKILYKDELKIALIEKIIEEAKEISNADENELAAEIADIQQVIDDLTKLYGIKPSDIIKAKNKKSEKAGDFNKGHYVYYVDVNEDNVWIEYYEKNSDRYPKI